MSALVPAKLNLTLHVLDRQSDGYHSIHSLIAFVDIGDRIHIRTAEDISLEITGPFAEEVGGKEENLVIKAARLIADVGEVACGAAISLEKNLPVGGGLGGGSSDAALTLRLLCQLWKLDYTSDQLATIALPLGADLPVCCIGQAAMVSGVGEIVHPIGTLPQMYVVLVNPGLSISTADVYRRTTIQAHYIEDDVLEKGDMKQFISWLERGDNDLTEAASSLVPEIKEVLKVLAGQENCLLARMSGSGATCFGLFSDKHSATQACDAIKKNHPQWWVEEGRLLSQIEA